MGKKPKPERAGEKGSLARAREEIRRRGDLLLASATDGIYFLDTNGIMVESSDSFCRMLGYTHEEMIGMHISRWNAQFTDQELRVRIGEILSVMPGEKHLFETIHRRKDGRLLPVEIAGAPVEFESGTFLYCSARDISFRKQGQDKLVAMRNQLQTILDSLPDLLFEIDLNGLILSCHPSNHVLSGTPSEGVPGKNLRDVFPPEVAGIALLAIRKADVEGHSGGEYLLPLPDGIHHYEFSVSKKPVAPDESPKFILMSRDISARKRAEKMAKRLSDFNLLLAQVNQVAVIATDETTLIRSACDLAVRYGQLELAWVGHPDERGTFLFSASAGATGFLDSFLVSSDPDIPEGRGPEGQAFRKDRAVFSSSLEADPTRTPWKDRARAFSLESIAALPLHRKGQVYALLNLCHREKNAFNADLESLLRELALDLSRGIDRLDAERREREVRALQQALLDNTQAGIALVRDRRILNINKRLMEILGYPAPEELLNRETRLLYEEEASFRKVGELYPVLLVQGHATLSDVGLRRMDGSTVLCDLSGTLVHDTDGRTAVWTIQDVTSRHIQLGRIQRLSDYNALLAEINQAVATSEEETALFQSVCRIAVGRGLFGLAWVGRPDESGTFRFLAAAGETGFLEDIRLSADPDSPEGKGPAGSAWRTGGPGYFSCQTEGHPDLDPWKERIRQFGWKSAAALPIRRGKALWALLMVYQPGDESFGPDLRALLEEVVQTLSRGLDRLDILNHQALLSNALASVKEGVILTDPQERILYVNPAFTSITGYSAQEVAGKNCRILQGKGTDPATVARIRQAINSRETFQGQILNVRKDGSKFWNLLTINPVIDSGGKITQFVGVQRDITDLRHLSDQMEFQSLHDSLTALPNRRALDHHLSMAIARADRHGSLLAVGMIDLDDFKGVNDRFGHETGDRLLQELAKRFQSLLRENDFLVRLGGDEFVVVIEDLEDQRSSVQIAPILERLHGAVERPFDLGVAEEITIGMSLGLAIYPVDAREGETLLRQSDIAMYQIKEKKYDRALWWQQGMTRGQPGQNPITEREEGFDSYGPLAGELLLRNLPRIDLVTWQFVEDFYAHLARDPEQANILKNLSPEEMESLRLRQVRHLQFLLGPETTRPNLLKRAREVGRIHALVGVGGPLLLQSKALYSRLLIEHINRALLAARDRYRILLAAEDRLQDDIQEELRSEVDMINSYLDLLSPPLPQQGTLWTDAIGREIVPLGTLSGIQAVLLLRPDSQGFFRVEASSGPIGGDLAATLKTSGQEILLDPDSPRGKGLVPEAWRTLRNQSAPSLGTDPRFAFFWELVSRNNGIRSGLSIPIKNEDGKAVAVLSLSGGYPNQFESTWMKQFGQGLAQRWERIWALCNAPKTVVDEDRAADFRKELFAGGLSMYMQPVVDLRSGRLMKAEALARLVMPDGQIVGPNLFLPVMGDSDINWLFRTGLSQALSALSRWDGDGMSIGVSVNLPPSTLRDPDCPRWVEETLDQHAIDPRRLTLELLENQAIDCRDQDETIRRLSGLGVKLAMDDLGSGYSSLQRLSTLPFDNIKVDQGLLSRIRIIPLETLGMIGAIVQMGREFDHEVVVEGLEDLGMVEAAAILGASYGQGFHLAKPMPADQIPPWERTFRIPLESGRIRTSLGALTFHWRNHHRETSLPLLPLESCPLTRFFRDQDQGASPGARWHEEVHGSEKGREGAGKRLMDWLVRRVQEEGEGKNGTRS